MLRLVLTTFISISPRSVRKSVSEAVEPEELRFRVLPVPFAPPGLARRQFRQHPIPVGTGNTGQTHGAGDDGCPRHGPRSADSKAGSGTDSGFLPAASSGGATDRDSGKNVPLQIDFRQVTGQRLGNVVERPILEGADHLRDRAMGAHHDERPGPGSRPGSARLAHYRPAVA